MLGSIPDIEDTTRDKTAAVTCRSGEQNEVRVRCARLQ